MTAGDNRPIRHPTPGRLLSAAGVALGGFNPVVYAPGQGLDCFWPDYRAPSGWPVVGGVARLPQMVLLTGGPIAEVLQSYQSTTVLPTKTTVIPGHVDTTFSSYSYPEITAIFGPANSPHRGEVSVGDVYLGGDLVGSAPAPHYVASGVISRTPYPLSVPIGAIDSYVGGTFPGFFHDLSLAVRFHQFQIVTVVDTVPPQTVPVGDPVVTHTVDLTTYFPPGADMLLRVKAAIEAARPGRTFVTVRTSSAAFDFGQVQHGLVPDTTIDLLAPAAIPEGGFAGTDVLHVHVGAGGSIKAGGADAYQAIDQFAPHSDAYLGALTDFGLGICATAAPLFPGFAKRFYGLSDPPPPRAIVDGTPLTAGQTTALAAFAAGPVFFRNLLASHAASLASAGIDAKYVGEDPSGQEIVNLIAGYFGFLPPALG